MDRPERKVLWLPAGEIRPNPMQPQVGGQAVLGRQTK